MAQAGLAAPRRVRRRTAAPRQTAQHKQTRVTGVFPFRARLRAAAARHPAAATPLGAALRSLTRPLPLPPTSPPRPAQPAGTVVASTVRHDTTRRYWPPRPWTWTGQARHRAAAAQQRSTMEAPPGPAWSAWPGCPAHYRTPLCSPGARPRPGTAAAADRAFKGPQVPRHHGEER